MKHILCCDGFRTDTGICKSNILRDLFVKVMAHHQHIQMLVQSIYSKWHCRVCGRRKDIRCCCRLDDVRCMSAAGTLCMVCMDGSSTDGIDGILNTSTLVQSICMDGHLHIIFICYIQAMIDNCRSCTPVLMDLKSHGTCFDLFDQRLLIGAVSFSKESKVHRIFLCCLKHHFHVPWSRSTSCRIRSICRTGSSTDHCCHAGIQCTVDLLRADKVDMRINTTGCHDHTLSCKSLRRSAYRHTRCHTVHHAWVSCLTDSFDLAVLDTDICFDDSCTVHDQSVCDNEIKISVCTGCLNRLSHTVTDGLTASEFNFITISGIVFFYLNDQICICQTYLISSCRAIHHCIFFTGNFYTHESVSSF